MQNLSQTVLQMIHQQKPGWNTLPGFTPLRCLSVGQRQRAHHTPSKVLKRLGLKGKSCICHGRQRNSKNRQIPWLSQGARASLH